MKRLLPVLLLVPLALAQDPGPDGAGDPVKERADAISALTDAILKLQALQDVVVTAEVAHHKPEAKAGQPGQGGIVVLAGPGGRVAQPFEGAVEAWRDAQGVTVLRSSEALPGFRMYVDDERTIKEVTFERDRPGLRQIEAELAVLADPQRLVEHLKTLQRNPELRTTHDEITGATVIGGPVAKEIVRPVRSGIEVPGAPAGLVLRGMGGPRVLKARMTAVVREGRFASITIRLTRNDPTAEMMRGVKGGRVRIVPGGGGGFGVEPDKDGKAKDEKHDIEGGSTSYTLRFAEQPPSDELRAFKRRVRKMLAR